MGQAKKSINGKRETRDYTASFKMQAVQLALRSATIEQVATELGIPKATLYQWVSRFKTGQLGHQPEADEQPQMTREQLQIHLEQSHANLAKAMEENRCLNREVATLTEEKAILKKLPSTLRRNASKIRLY